MPIERLSVFVPGLGDDLTSDSLFYSSNPSANDVFLFAPDSHLIASSAASSNASSPRSMTFSDASTPPSFVVSTASLHDEASSSSSSGLASPSDLSPSICPMLLFDSPAMRSSESLHGHSTATRPIGSAIPEGTWSPNKSTPVVRPKPRRPSEQARANEMAKEVAALRQLVRSMQQRRSSDPIPISGHQQARKRKNVDEHTARQQMRRVTFAAMGERPPLSQSVSALTTRRDEDYWVDLLKTAEAKRGADIVRPAIFQAASDSLLAKSTSFSPSA